MFTEQEIEKLMAEVILRTVKESKFSTNIKDFCAENQIDRGKLMAKKASNGPIWVLLSEEKQKQKSLTLKNSDDDE